VRSSFERAVRGLEVRSRGRADVHDIRPRFREQGLGRGEHPGARERSELLRPAERMVVHADHDRGSLEPFEGVQVVASHLACADECGAERSVGHTPLAHRRLHTCSSSSVSPSRPGCGLMDSLVTA